MAQVRINGPRVEPYVKALAPVPRRRGRHAIRLFANGPRPKYLAIKLLETDPTGTRYYRFRLGPHRIVDSVQPDGIYVHRAFHPRDGYGWLERSGAPP